MGILCCDYQDMPAHDDWCDIHVQGHSQSSGMGNIHEMAGRLVCAHLCTHTAWLLHHETAEDVAPSVVRFSGM